MTDILRPRRSVLYLPAANPRAIAKARTVDADCIILDLEDAVAPDAKVEARAAAVAAVAECDWGHREVLIRVNSLSTVWSIDDFAAVAASHAAGIVVPKVDSAREAEEAVARSHGKPVWAMIETPRAIFDAADIAAVFGGRRVARVRVTRVALPIEGEDLGAEGSQEAVGRTTE